MMKRIVPALVLASMIAAPAVAADLPARAVGLWQSITTVTGPDGQPLPNASNVVTVSCVDQLNDQKFFTSEQSDCSSLNIAGSGSNYTIDGTCQGQGQQLRIHETLVYADSRNLQLKAVYDGKGGHMTVTSQLQWQGPCPPGMQAGDEGNISGGVFNKSDNINDTANQ
jgi:hypothetical protein